LNSCDSCFYVIGKLAKSYDSGRLFMPSLGTMDFQSQLNSNGYATRVFWEGETLLDLSGSVRKPCGGFCGQD
jgi:hypothetical protein